MQHPESEEEIAKNLLTFARTRFSPEHMRANLVSPYHRSVRRRAHCAFPAGSRSERARARAPQSREECRGAGGRWRRATAYDVKRRNIESTSRAVDTLSHRCSVCQQVFDNVRRVPWGCVCQEHQDFVHYMCAVCYDERMRAALARGETRFACPICGDPTACESPARMFGHRTEEELYAELVTGLDQMIQNGPADPMFDSNIAEIERLAGILTETGWIDAVRGKVQVCRNMRRFLPGAEGYEDARRSFNSTT